MKTSQELIDQIVIENIGLRARVAECCTTIMLQAAVSGKTNDEAKQLFEECWETLRDTAGKAPECGALRKEFNLK